VAERGECQSSDVLSRASGRASHEGAFCVAGADGAGAACDAGEVVTARANGDGAVGNIGVGVPTVGEERSQRRISRSEPP
jgi:hypothetical protein